MICRRRLKTSSVMPGTNHCKGGSGEIHMSRSLPILFNYDMVRAILDDRKSVTRRLINPQPKMKLLYTYEGPGKERWGYPDKNDWKVWGEEYRLPDSMTECDASAIWTPPCAVGDVLYVRETWKIQKIHGKAETEYKADYLPREDFERVLHTGDEWSPWRSSIHMPKEKARIFLKVTEVRTGRLWDMGDAETKKEGVFYDKWSGRYHYRGFDPYDEKEGIYKSPLEAMKALWDSTLKKPEENYGWESNPWVWVIEFERCEKPEDF